MNAFHIAGYLGNDPESGQKNDKTWSRLRVAVNGRGEEPDWFNVVCFGKLAETVTAQLKTSDGVAVTGRLQVSRSDEYGEQVNLIANSVQFFKRQSAAEDS